MEANTRNDQLENQMKLAIVLVLILLLGAGSRLLEAQPQGKRAQVRDWICQDMPRGREFVAFNCETLSDEPITDADIRPCTVLPDSIEASQTWSAGCLWYFINTDAGIVLAQPGESRAVVCLKRSWAFLEAFIEAPITTKQKRRIPQ